MEYIADTYEDDLDRERYKGWYAVYYIRMRLECSAGELVPVPHSAKYYVALFDDREEAEEFAADMNEHEEYCRPASHEDDQFCEYYCEKVM